MYKCNKRSTHPCKHTPTSSCFTNTLVYTPSPFFVVQTQTHKSLSSPSSWPPPPPVVTQNWGTRFVSIRTAIVCSFSHIKVDFRLTPFSASDYSLGSGVLLFMPFSILWSLSLLSATTFQATPSCCNRRDKERQVLSICVQKLSDLTDWCPLMANRGFHWPTNNKYQSTFTDVCIWLDKSKPCWWSFMIIHTIFNETYN